MPQITAIEPQKSSKRRKSRFNIYLDGNFAFAVDENTLVKNNLRINQQITQEQVEKLLKETVLSKFQDLALRFLSYRQRSEKEVRDYLTNKIAKKENIKYQEAKESPLIEKIISKLRRYNYLNDRQFAKWWIAARKFRPKGLNLIKLELIKKGIDKDIIEEVLSGSGSQLELAQIALTKKIKKFQKLPPIELKKRVYQYLSNRGFDYDTIRQVFAHLVKKL
ncbi:RecX family transcriptional regulator [Candidatus Curtissbacteria bacterium]|nr:RecX family transcriptional regulator [Candidatus Curtissbacteria bacterium]